MRLFNLYTLHPAFFRPHVFHLSCHCISHETEAEMGSGGGKGPGMLEIRLQSSKRCLQQLSSTLLLKFWSFNLISSTNKPRHEKKSRVHNGEHPNNWDLLAQPNQYVQQLQVIFLAGCNQPPSLTNPWHRCSLKLDHIPKNPTVRIPTKKTWYTW